MPEVCRVVVVVERGVGVQARRVGSHPLLQSVWQVPKRARPEAAAAARFGPWPFLLGCRRYAGWWWLWSGELVCRLRGWDPTLFYKVYGKYQSAHDRKPPPLASAFGRFCRAGLPKGSILRSVLESVLW